MEQSKTIAFQDFARFYSEHKRELLTLTERVYSSGWYVLGKEGEAFEEEFSGYLGSPHCVGVASGTEAIQLALMACEVGAGDEVITVPNTALPTLCAITSAGAVPRLVDVDSQYYTMNVDQIRSAITSKTKAIIPVHLFGQACDMTPVLEIAKEYGLKVIEDACQAHGATYFGKKVGTLGDAGCFSFYPTKNLGAMGDGGAVSTSQPEIAQRLKRLRNYGQKVRYHHESKGINSRLDEIQAAILRYKLKLLNEFNIKRRHLAQLYHEGLSDLPIVLPRERSGVESAWHLYVIQTSEREKLMESLKKMGIETLIHYPVPAHLQGAYPELQEYEGKLKVAEMLSGRILTLPLYPELQESEVRNICQAIRNYFKR